MIQEWHMSIPSLTPDFSRRVYIATPAAYDEEPDRCFPVLYMFDGQNVFYDEDASFGTSWNMASYIESQPVQCIIVAVEGNPFGNLRLSEYSPFSHNTPELGPISPKARTMMHWLLHVLKPSIDREFRTLPDRENTFLAGSSMGGLISLYGITAFNNCFSRAACLSPSLWVSPGKALYMIDRSDIASHTVIYLDYGSEEMGNHTATHHALIDCVHACLRKNVDLTFRIDPYGDHSEASWAQRVPVFMHCLDLV